MVELNLATNQLTKIPEDICGLVSLEVACLLLDPISMESYLSYCKLPESFMYDMPKTWIKNVFV